MLVSSVSFGSTYRVHLKYNNWDAMKDVSKLSLDQYDRNGIINLGYNGDDVYHTIVVDDKADNAIENFLNSKFINYIKRTNSFLYSEAGIRRNIRINPFFRDSYLPELVEIKTKKFDESYRQSSPWQYIGTYEEMDNPERYDGFIKYIKTDSPINAPEVSVHDRGFEPEIVFQDGRHRYAYMRDKGFKTIPVAMDEESYAVAIKYGLV